MGLKRFPSMCFLFCVVAPAAEPNPDSAVDWFLERAEALGVHFRHEDGRSGQRYYVETATSGGGWLDYDGDGDLDLYLVNGALTPGSKKTAKPRNALYENRGARFVEVTGMSGSGDEGYGMGMCAGDYDGDGNLDLFVTNYGPDRLFRNRGDGTFEEVAAASGVAGDRWGTNCAFGDVDGDGDLDLYVANYVAFTYANNPQCGNATANTLSYCRPDAFKGQNDYLYINQGNGHFQDEAARRGIRQNEEGKCFGALLSDIDDDGDLDIFVASDGTMNRFYVNDGRGFFEDQSLLSGLAFNAAGEAEAGMGMDLGDADGNGLLDLIVTNYAHETHTLYLNRGDLFFEDHTAPSGLVAPSLSPVGWGVRFFDFDNDGDLDLAVANGHVIDNVVVIEPGASYPQTNQLFENDGAGKFRDVSVKAGQAFAVKKVSRGLAVGDWNDDGRLDLLITNTNDQPDLLQNNIHNGHHWIGLSLQGPKPNPFAIGAKVFLKGSRLLGIREVRSGGSMLSQSDLRLHFGLGTYAGPVTAEIHWPGGRKQIVAFSQIDRYHKITYQSP